MAENRPLSYATWECVFPYFGYDTKTSLSRKCPSLQRLHLQSFTSPITIQHLQVTPMRLKIEKTTFQIGIIQQYHDRKNPEIVENNNRIGGFPHDTDEYGLPYSNSTYLEDRFADYNYQLKSWEEERKIYEKEEEGLFKRMSMLRIQRKIRELDEQFYPVHLKRSGQTPPYSLYIQLRIWRTGDKNKYIERVEYSSRTLNQCFDYILKKLLGNRRGTIKNQSVDWEKVEFLKQYSPILESFNIQKSVFIGDKIPKYADLQAYLREPHVELPSRQLDPYYINFVETCREMCFNHPPGQNIVYGEFDFGFANLAMASIYGLKDAVRMEKEELKGTRFPDQIVFQRQDGNEVQTHMVEIQKADQSIKYVLHVNIVAKAKEQKRSFWSFLNF